MVHDKVIKWTKAKVHVYSNWVLCLGKMQEHSEANARWQAQLQYFRHSKGYKELLGIDGEPIEFEWNIFPGHSTLQILEEIQDRMAVRQTSPEDFEDRIMYNKCFFSNSATIKNYAKKISAWTLVFSRFMISGRPVFRATSALNRGFF